MQNLIDKEREEKLKAIKLTIQAVEQGRKEGWLFSTDRFAELIMRDIEQVEIDFFERHHTASLEEQYRDRFGEQPF